MTHLSKKKNYTAMKRLLIFFMIVLFTVSGCSYSFVMNAYPHLKTVQVVPFENHTSEFSLAQDFQNFLVERYQSDGRLRISNLSPDSRVEGSVKDYRNEILSYDIAGNISEYRVSILFAITMTDMVQSNTFFDNQSMLESESYSPNIPPDTRTEHLRTEAEAIAKIFDKVFDAIMNSTLASW